MANVKRLDLRATVPFNYYEDQDLAARFAFMQSPSVGLRVTFGAEHYKANEHGGRTAFYFCEIHGQEAVAYEWIRALRASILRLGGSCQFSAHDVEGGEVVREGGERPVLETYEIAGRDGWRVRVTVPGSER